MGDLSQAAEFRIAVLEIQRYLGDEVAPMMVTDSMELLMGQPAELLAPQILAWVGNQCSAGDARNSMADYLYHTLKKLHLLAEFNLVDAEPLRKYLKDLSQHLMAVCPEEERDRLQLQVGNLGESESLATAAPVENIYRAGGGRPEAGASSQTGPARSAASAGDAVNEGFHRLTLLLERLGRNAKVGLQTQASPEVELIQAQALVAAAVQSQNDTELQEHLRRLGGAGVDSRSDQLFRMLSRSLPAWNIPLVAMTSEGEKAGYTNPSVEAMRKMVALAETPQEWAHRFNDLVQTAIEQFNTGSLARAATMLDLAERMLEGKERHLDVVMAIRRRAHEAIKEDMLRKYAERPEDRSVLLRFMNFFSAMRVEGLLKQLNQETKRERRWLLLLLLEAHGAEARAGALAELDEFAKGEKTENQGYHQRNLVRLLRKIPAGEAGPSEREFEILARLSRLDQPAMLAREAIRTLGSHRNPAAEQTLMTRLREFETKALRLAPAAGDGTPSPILELLDNLCAALVTQRTGRCMNEILRHALREEPALGDAAARLDVLGEQNLSDFPDTVGNLVQTLRDRLPRKILGLVMNKKESLLPHLIRALAGTPLPTVQATLEEIRSKYSTHEIGAEASKVLDGLKGAAQRTEQVSPGMTGDIDLFGLPNLFQTFSDSRVTGKLTLCDERGVACGVVRFREGKIRSCECLHLKGEDAVCQLFEKVEARKFNFQTETLPKAGGTPDNLMEVVPLLMEALRRHDELQQARALVPDGSKFRVTTTKPGPLEDETDLELTGALWRKIAGGATPEQCETAVQADTFRVRRLLAHWVEQGALQMAVTPAAATSA